MSWKTIGAGLRSLGGAALMLAVLATLVPTAVDAGPPVQVSALGQPDQMTPAPWLNEEPRQNLDLEAGPDGDSDPIYACPANCRRQCAQVFHNCTASRRVCLARRSACLRSCGC